MLQETYQSIQKSKENQNLKKSKANIKEKILLTKNKVEMVDNILDRVSLTRMMIKKAENQNANNFRKIK